MDLAVIVTSYDGLEPLVRCLRALAVQPAVAEIVVAEASKHDPSRAVAAEFPRVRVLHQPGVRSVPALRWNAVPHTRAPLVAAIESRVVPAPDWAETLVHAHRLDPDAPAIGGSVSNAGESGALGWAVYFSEYAAFAPPLESGRAAEISGANLSYKRPALDRAAAHLASGDWETKLHASWIAEGAHLRLCEANVEFHNAMSLGQALRQRFLYGRGYAASRFAGPRSLYALLAPFLCVVLTLRASRAAARARLLSKWTRAAPLTFLLNAAWAAGESAGYATGRAGRPRLI